MSGIITATVVVAVVGLFIGLFLGVAAIKFKVESEGKIIYSLYVVIGNNLYNLIFTGDEEGMLEVGEELFDEIVKSLEF